MSAENTHGAVAVGPTPDHADTAATRTDSPMTDAQPAAALQAAPNGTMSAENSSGAAFQADTRQNHALQTCTSVSDECHIHAAQSSTRDILAQPSHTLSSLSEATAEQPGLHSLGEHSEQAEPYAQQAEHGTHADELMDTAADDTTGVSQQGHVMRNESAASFGNAPQMAVLASLDQASVLKQTRYASPMHIPDEWQVMHAIFSTP